MSEFVNFWFVNQCNEVIHNMYLCCTVCMYLYSKSLFWNSSVQQWFDIMWDLDMSYTYMWYDVEVCVMLLSLMCVSLCVCSRSFPCVIDLVSLFMCTGTRNTNMIIWIWYSYIVIICSTGRSHDVYDDDFIQIFFFIVVSHINTIHPVWISEWYMLLWIIQIVYY